MSGHSETPADDGSATRDSDSGRDALTLSNVKALLDGFVATLRVDVKQQVSDAVAPLATLVDQVSTKTDRVMEALGELADQQEATVIDVKGLMEIASGLSSSIDDLKGEVARVSANQPSRHDPGGGVLAARSAMYDTLRSGRTSDPSHAPAGFNSQETERRQQQQLLQQQQQQQQLEEERARSEREAEQARLKREKFLADRRAIAERIEREKKAAADAALKAETEQRRKEEAARLAALREREVALEKQRREAEAEERRRKEEEAAKRAVELARELAEAKRRRQEEEQARAEAAARVLEKKNALLAALSDVEGGSDSSGDLFGGVATAAASASNTNSSSLGKPTNLFGGTSLGSENLFASPAESARNRSDEPQGRGRTAPTSLFGDVDDALTTDTGVGDLFSLKPSSEAGGPSLGDSNSSSSLNHGGGPSASLFDCETNDDSTPADERPAGYHDGEPMAASLFGCEEDSVQVGAQAAAELFGDAGSHPDGAPAESESEASSFRRHPGHHDLEPDSESPRDHVVDPSSTDPSGSDHRDGSHSPSVTVSADSSSRTALDCSDEADATRSSSRTLGQPGAAAQPPSESVPKAGDTRPVGSINAGSDASPVAVEGDVTANATADGDASPAGPGSSPADSSDNRRASVLSDIEL